MAIYRNKSTKVDLQIGAMRARYPQFKIKRKTSKEIEFVGELQPKPEYRKYKVSILYRGSLNPQVRILKPDLVDNPPHFYKGSGTLCLYHPKDFKWRKEFQVAKHILPITSAWLYFYEVWLETGVWFGPEAKHSKPKE